MGAPGRGRGGEGRKGGSGASAGSFFGGGGYASHGAYMVEKNRKLKEQFAAAALSSSATSAGEAAKSIFQGLSFWMTGRTCLPDQELKRLIVENGGVYEQYGFTRVSHIIADNLAAGNQTWGELKRRMKRGHVVTSSWVLDSIKEGRRLPETRYMPKCLAASTSMLSFLAPKVASGSAGQVEDVDLSLSPSQQAAPAALPGPEVHSPQLTKHPSANALGPGPTPSASSAAPALEEPKEGLESPGETFPRKKRQLDVSADDSQSLRPQEAAAPSPLALEVSAACPSGLQSHADLLELLGDLVSTIEERMQSARRSASAIGLRIGRGEASTLEEWCGVMDVQRDAAGAEFLEVALEELAGRAVHALRLTSAEGRTSASLSSSLADTMTPQTHTDKRGSWTNIRRVGVQVRCMHSNCELQSGEALKVFESSGPSASLPSSSRRHTSMSYTAGVEEIQSQPVPNTPVNVSQASSRQPACAAVAARPRQRRPRWRVLPVWVEPPEARPEELMEVWRAKCQALSFRVAGAARAAPADGQAGTASVRCHGEALRRLIESHEVDVAVTALRSLRAAITSGADSTLRQGGLPSLPACFNALLSDVQRALAAVTGGARLNLALLPEPGRR
eukprot:TRINITY_DN79853_c0_g1_i1.p1 TRINITY_DN79853_c0_g1~~TRINITY_DN79853_c0_g1_i1.p1  ORF type:complete len:620 (-),score=116.18 TRINITY_DN79853_c0_g1_i1:37-1896(-)